MRRPLIASLANPLIKRARALRQRKARAESGLFLVEGLHPVGEAIAAGWEIDTILYAPDLLTGEFAGSMLSNSLLNLQPVSGDVMRSLADKENPQGILALVKARQSTIGEAEAVRRAVAMVAPQDPGNVGTVLRTMDAAGVEALFLLDGGVDPYHPTSVRASMGALFWNPIIRASFGEALAWCETHGIERIATSAHAEIDYRAFRPSEPWMLILGSEQKGLNEEQLGACDVALSLPMRGRASSLNVAVAAGILLYRWTAA